MIAKKVPRQTKDSFGRLARYAADETKQSELAQSWGGLVNYVADTANEGAKVPLQGVRLTNLDGITDLDSAIRQVEQAQALSGASEKDRNYHLIISFPPGEVPTKQQLEDIEDELVKSIGLEDHQRVSGIHTNTDCLHIHVAISKVHPESLKVVEPYRDQPKLMAACKALEIKHGLTQTHADKVQMPDGTIVVTGKAADMEAKTGEKSLQRWIKENAKDELVAAKTWDELHEIAGRNGLELKKQGAGLVFVTTGNKAVAVKASDVDRSLSFKQAQARLGPFEARKRAQTTPQAPKPPQVAPERPGEDQADQQAPQEQDAAHDSQNGPQEEGAAPTGPDQEAKKAKEKKPRAGMTINEATEQGMFEEDAVTFEEARAAYVREPIERSPEAEALWQAYNAQKEAAPKNRDEAMAGIKERSDATKEWIKARRKYRRENARTEFFSQMEQEQFQREEDAKWQENRDEAAKAREKVFQETRAPNWYDFLCRESEQGNTEALKLLRQINKRRDVLANNILRAADWSEGKTILNDTTKKSVSKSGTVRYYTEDGGVVADRPDYVGVQDVSVGAAALALMLAAERFDRPLTVTGSDEFKAAVAAAAAIPGSKVTFADPEMEALRKAAIAEREEAQSRYSSEATYLFVPPQDKAEAKELGAKWDAGLKRWHVPAKMDLAPFEKWRKVDPGADLKGPGTPLIVPYEFRDFVKEAGAQWDGDKKAWTVPAGVDPKSVGLGDFVADAGRYSNEKTFLHVPMADKDEVKELGARWDKNAKAWFAPPSTDLEPFSDWRKSTDDLVSELVDTQNATTDEISIIKKHRAWAEGDAMDGSYAGTVQLTPRLKAILLETDGEVIVKAITPEEADMTAKLTHGARISMNEKGALSTGKSRSKSRGR